LAATGADRRGTDSIVTTMFRVNGHAALEYWRSRFDEHNIKHGDIESVSGRELLRFEDRENQRLALVDDGGLPFVLSRGTVQYSARLRHSWLLRDNMSIPRLASLAPILTEVLAFNEVERTTTNDNEMLVIYGMDGGGPGKEVHVIEQPGKAAAC